MQEHRIEVRRTARYVTLGPQHDTARGVLFALHGYGQLATRFARAFTPLDDGSRRIVVPEGLSRYYVDHAGRKVGASWMTREDRGREISDYVAYLNAVYAATVPAGTEYVDLLGFSQGSATACRWVERGTVRPRRLILWGGEIPPDLDWGISAERFRQIDDVLLVVGDSDEFATPSHVARYEQLLASHKVPHRGVTFEGGHELDAGTLRTLLSPD